MNKKLKDLLKKINAAKAAVRQLVEDGKLDEAEAKKAELADLQRQFDLLHDLDDDAPDAEDPQADGTTDMTDSTDTGAPRRAPTFARIAAAMADALGAAVGRRKLTDEDKRVLTAAYGDEINDAMSEGTDEDGGFTVPKDVRTRVEALRRTSDDLTSYVTVERVTTASGSRTYEKDADATPWPDVDENGEFTEVDTPQYTQVSYKITKKGGILKTSLELLADTAENIVAHLMAWIAKKTRATRNHRILTKMDAITSGKEVAIKGLDDLKQIFNVQLDPAIASTSAVFTNQDGLQWLDTLKDTDGKYVLQPDPTDATVRRLFGRYIVHVLSNKTLKSGGEPETTVEVPIYCGDLAEAIVLFDRERMTVESSKEAGDAWTKDQLHFKVRERFDVQAKDEAALVKGKVTINIAG